MTSKLVKICLLLITLAVLIGVGFYSWSVTENLKLQKIKIFETKVPPLSEWGR